MILSTNWRTPFQSKLALEALVKILGSRQVQWRLTMSRDEKQACWRYFPAQASWAITHDKRSRDGKTKRTPHVTYADQPLGPEHAPPLVEHA